jgi:hypothetical protein
MIVKPGAIVDLIKIIVLVINLSLVYPNNKLYFLSTYIPLAHNYYGNPDISLSTQLATNLLFPSEYGPKLSRNCSIGITETYIVSNGLHKSILFDYTTSAGFTNIQE